MTDPHALYQQIIRDHHRAPRRRAERLTPPASRAEIRNPLCGDQVTLFIEADSAGRLEVHFLGDGCAISLAAASLLSDSVSGLPPAKAAELLAAVRRLVADGAAPEVAGDLAALGAVAPFPARHRCALLAWEALESALLRLLAPEP